MNNDAAGVLHLRRRFLSDAGDDNCFRLRYFLFAD
jgi:hypothetical protein